MKSNFKRNLLIGFSASLVILIVSSVASYISIRNLLQSAELVNHTNAVIIKMDEVARAMVDAETGQRGYLLAGEETFLAPYNDSRARAVAAFSELREMTSDNISQQENLVELKRLIDERFKYLEISIDDKKSGRPVKPENLRQGRMIMTEIRDLIERMEKAENVLLVQRTKSMNQFSAYTPPLIVSAALIALLITISFYIRVRSDFEDRVRLQSSLEQKDKEISSRIGIIRGIADQIAQGKYAIRVDDRQSDELGSVALSLNRMAESLEYSFNLLSDKEWLQSGLSKLNDLIIGEKSVDVLSKEIVAFLSEYTKSQTGVVYILEEGVLRVSGGYAFTPNPSRSKFELNEGIPGQAVTSGKVIELRDIPPDSIQISFATGEAKPNHVVAVPVFDGYLIKGVIELATLGSYSKRDIEFLTASAANIGIAISTSQNRRKLQELLEETQSQSEELKTQHSELENLNSELEVQAEKLQASEEELKVQQEELKQANQELEERSRLLEERNQVISERNVEIQDKADQLAQSTKYKSEFLANMSHELRTPLNSILLLSRLMSENPQRNLTEDQIEYAKVIQTSGHGLLLLIDEILDLSKIEAGKMSLEYDATSVKGIIADMSGLFQPVAAEKGIQFKTMIAADVPESIETDKLRLEQILKNLLSNALKFTSKGFVALSVTKEEHAADFINISVKDTGIGIAKEKQGIVFDAFQQADGSTRRKYGGTGLGLSISRELAKLLGGDITLQSEAGEGSEFQVRIPIRKPLPNKSVETTRPKEMSNHFVLEEPKILEKKYISTHIPENISDDRQQIMEGDKSILIIEDDVHFAKSLLEFTRKKGYKGVVAVRGDEGIQLANRFLPLGILLDVQLPVKSGWEVMEELKNSPVTRHIPVHMMSSHQVKSESLLKGAVDFINKPFAFEQMQGVFEKIEYVLTHHPKKVLIVEENSRHAKALAYFLETFDINLEINSEVNEAIDSLKRNNVDCVILDMGIPDQKSYDTLDLVKRTPGLENLPIIIFTGKSLSQAEELRIKQYADSIVVKTAHSYKRILDEVSLFLHLMEEKEVKEEATSRFHKLGALDDVLKGKKVLVADDDMRNIFSLTKALEKYEMNVVVAVDGKDALQKLNENPDVDVVLMDMMMPEMDGYESTEAIRKDKRFKNLPVIAVTAKAMMGDRAKCISAGASDYITKPVDVDQLFSLLRVWLYERV